MKALPLRLRQILFLTSCVIFLGTVQHSLADLILQKVPPLTVEQAPSYPENLARYALGAQIEVTPQNSANARLQLSSLSQDSNTAAAALLCDDPTIGFALAGGTTTMIVSLPNIENVENISFLNRDAQGNVRIAISSTQLPADSPQWRDAAQHELEESKALKLKIGPTEAQYVKLTFDVTQPGRIADLGLYSTAAVSDFTMPRPRKVSLDAKQESLALVTSNLTDVHAKARALYVSSGGDAKDANNMIDDQPATIYTFAGSDANPVAVIDLGKTSSLRRISAIYSPRKGNVDFYVLESLPLGSKSESEQLSASALQKGAPAGQTPAATAAVDLPQTVSIAEDAFRDLKPVGSVANSEGEGRAAIDFPETTGRYIMVRWNSAAPSDTPLSVAEVAAFGGTKPAPQIVAFNEERSNGGLGDGKTLLQGDGKTILDDKDMPVAGLEPEPPAEAPPPGLPQHPPFTFIPEIVPTSP